jgi:NAD-dependent dihydropyrimidine dehydrogenase PreA subunit
MAYVITQKCISEVYAACQQVCPADCMHYVAGLPAGYPSAGQPMMVVDSNECIDCGACKPECPIDAIVAGQDQDPYWAQINTNLGPVYKGQKTPPRAKTEAPRRPDNSLVG